MASAESPVHIGTATDGTCLVRIAGRATMQHSPSTEALITETLQHDPAVSVAIDLSDCTYLDSTFLGCLFGLFRRFVQKSPGNPRVRYYAPESKIKALFGPLHLDRVLRAEPNPAPAPAGPLFPMNESPTDRKAICQHVMECHRRLAETDSPAKVAFTKIADAMEQELKK